jgi:hypothetical protein
LRRGRRKIAQRLSRSRPAKLLRKNEVLIGVLTSDRDAARSDRSHHALAARTLNGPLKNGKTRDVSIVQAPVEGREVRPQEF